MRGDQARGGMFLWATHIYYLRTSIFPYFCRTRTRVWLSCLTGMYSLRFACQHNCTNSQMVKIIYSNGSGHMKSPYPYFTSQHPILHTPKLCWSASLVCIPCGRLRLLPIGTMNINVYVHQGRRQGEGENPPETEKNCWRKMVLFPKALFLVTNLKIIIIQFFYRNLIKKFQKFLNTLCFSSKRARI